MTYRRPIDLVKPPLEQLLLARRFDSSSARAPGGLAKNATAVVTTATLARLPKIRLRLIARPVRIIPPLT